MQIATFRSIRPATQKNLPPTQDSLEQHVLRAVYQATFVWIQSLIPMENLLGKVQINGRETSKKIILCHAG